MNWLQLADTTLHSGRRSSFKIEADGLTDDEMAAGGALLAKILPPFRRAVGVPRGGVRVAEALAPFTTDDPSLPILLVDDVWTTGGSMNAYWTEHINEPCLWAVLFSRGPVPPRVTVLCAFNEGLWTE